MTKRVLIAGCGDVGLRVARRLQARGDEVTCLRRSASALPEGMAAFAADLTDPHSLRGLPRDITHVVYLPTPDGRSRQAYEAIYRHGLAQLLAALNPSRLQRLLFVSSSAVYGEHGGAWVDEDTPANPLGFNGDVLLQAEHWLAAQPVPAVVVRLAGLYGPGRTQLFERLRSGEAGVPRDPAFWANRVHVDDAAAAIVHLLRHGAPARCYLGVDDRPLPLADLHDYLAELLHAPRSRSAAPAHGIGNKRLTNSRLRNSGFIFRWPDCRVGYAALLAPEA